MRSPPTAARGAHAGRRVLLSGECAGGGLAVSLAVALAAAGDPPPAAIQVVSPFCDLTVSAPSVTENAASDP